MATFEGWNGVRGGRRSGTVQAALWASTWEANEYWENLRTDFVVFAAFLLALVFATLLHLAVVQYVVLQSLLSSVALAMTWQGLSMPTSLNEGRGKKVVVQ
jgi:hypothetical protein